MAPIGSVLLAPSPSSGAKYDLTYYLKAAAAGGICCSITHGALTPVDGTFVCLLSRSGHFHLTTAVLIGSYHSTFLLNTI